MSINFLNLLQIAEAKDADDSGAEDDTSDDSDGIGDQYDDASDTTESSDDLSSDLDRLDTHFDPSDRLDNSVSTTNTKLSDIYSSVENKAPLTGAPHHGNWTDRNDDTTGSYEKEPGAVSSISMPEFNLPITRPQTSFGTGNDYRVGGGVSFGFGGAFGLGVGVLGQLSPNVGSNGTDITGAVFLPLTGIGFVVAPPSGFLSANLHTKTATETPQHGANLDYGCVRAIVAISPIGSIQLSRSSTEAESPITDISFSLGLSLSLGVFGGLSCTMSIRSPDTSPYP
jgi:hypothetical protein